LRDLKEQARLRSYILGDIGDQELPAIEMRLMADEDYFQEFTMAEEDLIQDYINGNLNPPEREKFEKRFLVSEENIGKVRFARALQKAADEANDALPPETKPNFFDSLKAFFTAPLPVAVIILAIVGVAGFFVWQSYNKQSEILLSLNKAYKDDRPTKGRITGFDYAPEIEGTRGVDKNENLDLIAAKSDAAKAAKNETAEGFYQLGLVFLAENNFDEAIKYFEKGIKKNPNFAKLHNDLGVAFMEKGLQKEEGSLELFGKAGDEIENAIKLDKNLTEAYFNRALVKELQNTPNQAQEAWENYLKLDSNSKWADEAREHLQKLKANKPISKTKDEILEEFEDAKKQNNEDLAWRILSRNREMIESKLIPQQLAALYVNAKFNKKTDESERWMALLNYAGELEEKKSGDLFWKDISKYYGNIKSEEQISALNQAQESINYGYELLRTNKWEDAGQAFSNSRTQFLNARDVWESKLAEFWMSYPLFLNHKYTESYAALEPVAEYANQNNYKWLNSQALGWLGINAGNTNRFSQEIEFYRKSLHFADETGDLYNQQKMNGQTADFYLQHGQYQDSLRFAEKISKNVSPEETSFRQKQRNYDVLARLFFSFGLNEAAANYKKEALAAWAENKRDRVYPWVNYTDLAVIYGKQGKYKEAFETLEKARAAAEGFEGEDVRIAYVDLQAAQVKRFSNDFAGAIEFYNKAIAFYDSTEPQPHRYTAHKGKLLCLLALKDNDGFENELRTVFGILNQYRGEILEDSTSVSFFDGEQVVYDAAIDYQISKGNYQEGLDYSEESRSRSLFDLLNQKGMLMETEVRPDVKRPTGISNPLAINDVRSQLPDNLQVIQFTVLSDKVLIWSFSRESFDFEKVDVDIDSLRADVKSYLNLISDRSDANLREETLLSKKLYKILIGHIESKLDKNRIICFIPDKFLFQIPFSTLMSPDSGKYLIAEHTIFSSPSANVLLACINRSNALVSNNPEKILAIGNPTFNTNLFPNLRRLQSAAAEAQKIAKFYDSSSSVLVEKQATKENVINELSQTDVIQFAGHYLVNDTSPLLSGFVLSSDGEDDYKHSFLSNSEIFNLDLSRVKLIILSACQTGHESIFDGEGPVGATRSFLAKGVPQIVASHWSVDSASTAQLMVQFQQNRKEKGFTTIEALRKAQLELIETKEFSRPYFWGAFDAIGGYQ
jgi:CHAT domain-containing protein